MKVEHIKRLNERIKDIKTDLELYPIILEKAKKFNGKVMNKRFETEMEDNPNQIYASYCKLGTTYRLIIYREDRWNTPLVSISNITYAEIVVDKRFVYQKFEKWVATVQDNLKDELKRLENDLVNSDERLAKFNDLIKQANELKKSFSSTYRDLNRYDFDKIY